MLDSVNGVGTIYVKQPKEYNKYEYGVEINGKNKPLQLKNFRTAELK